MMTYQARNEEQTQSIGKQLASMLTGGEIVTLSGALGAGKTTFTKGFAEGLGVTDTITSPTFAIMNLYPASCDNKAIRQFVHIDTYRLETERELFDIGVEEYLGTPNTVTVIEWPEKIPTLLSTQNVITVRIEHSSDTERAITIHGI